MSIFAIAIGIFLLIKGGDWLMRASVALSLNFSIPKIVIGMTVVSFATSAPELIVSIQAALSGHPDFALGNVVGSNIANLGLVLGLTAIISPISVPSSFYKTDWPMMILSSVLFYYLIVIDNKLDASEGAFMFILLIIFIFYLIKFQSKTELNENNEIQQVLTLNKTVSFLLLGGFSLWLGSETLIKGSVSLAESMGVSERIISVSIVSLGSIIAIINKEKAISIGNLVGSNIFNLMAVLGITAMIHPLSVEDPGLLSNDVLWMLGISFLILPLVFLPMSYRLSLRDGLILIIIYGLFILPLIL